MDIFHFKGKESVRNHHLAAPYHELVPVPAKSVLAPGEKPNMNGNLVIHGDNLLALKALLPTHAGKVDVIYIDPPYNTGNEKWAYNDNVDSPIQREWLGKVVDKEDLTRHDKWCCMMWPRLRLMRLLLAETGAIFVSIDDNEQHRLRMLMDEIFGEDNFVTNIVWEKKYSPANDAKYFSSNHDFVVCYAKNKDKDGWERRLLPRTESTDKYYQYDDNDGNGSWQSGDLTVKTYSPDMDYPIVNPNTGQEHWPPHGTCWRFTKKRMEELIAEDRVFWGKTGRGVPRLKRYRKEVRQGIVPKSLWRYDHVGHTDRARKALKAIFPDERRPFENPKPVPLIELILQIGGGPDAVVLDSFAGSGTTAHAVLSLNPKDSGTRKFVLVECEDYADTTTAERIRRVIRKDDDLAPMDTSFTYHELGESLASKSLLTGNLPSWENLARYLFFTATGEHLSGEESDEQAFYAGSSRLYEVYLYYRQDLDFLKEEALTLEKAKEIPPAPKGKRRLVFGPCKFVNDDMLHQLGIEFCRLPFDIMVPVTQLEE